MTINNELNEEISDGSSESGFYSNDFNTNRSGLKTKTRSQDSMDSSIKEAEVVISGISGRYPESNDIEEFKENLFAARNLISKDNSRWPVGQ